MEKIKAFFQNKITKIVAWLVLALDIVVLFLGNVTESEIVDGVKMVFVIIAGVAMFIAFISERVSKKKQIIGGSALNSIERFSEFFPFNPQGRISAFP